MGRHRKFRKWGGQTAYILEEREDADGNPVLIRQYVITTGDYHRPEGGPSYYKVVRVSHPAPKGGVYYRGAWWVRAKDLIHVPEYDRTTRAYIGKVVAKNKLIEPRGCGCQCCIHYKMKPGDVKPDGTYAWEDE